MALGEGLPATTIDRQLGGFCLGRDKVKLLELEVNGYFREKGDPNAHPNTL